MAETRAVEGEAAVVEGEEAAAATAAAAVTVRTEMRRMECTPHQ